MRLLIVPLFVLSMTGCMTQRDQSVWQEFKSLLAGDASSPAEAAPAAAEPISAPSESKAEEQPAAAPIESKAEEQPAATDADEPAAPDIAE